jgi:hypothetical protein
LIGVFKNAVSGSDVYAAQMAVNDGSKLPIFGQLRVAHSLLSLPKDEMTTPD